MSNVDQQLPTGPASGADIFLSYARRDRSTARIIAESLIHEGFSVWWDASLHSGETFDEVIERNLREARAVVVLWSPASVASRWVRAEATLADRRNKLVPAIIETCDRPILFELTQTAELAEWKGDRTDGTWRTFVEDLSRLVHEGRKHSKEEFHEVSLAATSAQEFAAVSDTDRRPQHPCDQGGEGAIPAGAAHPSFALKDPKPVLSNEQPEDEVHVLKIEPGEPGEQVIRVTAGGAMIGRKAPADIVLPHRSISREHCMIGVANDELLVTDLSSTNGTFIDDVRVTRTTILPVGSVLRVGEISMRHAIQGDGATRLLGNPREPAPERIGRLAAAS